jgi:hypothetical protein
MLQFLLYILSFCVFVFEFIYLNALSMKGFKLGTYDFKKLSGHKNVQVGS